MAQKEARVAVCMVATQLALLVAATLAAPPEAEEVDTLEEDGKAGFVVVVEGLEVGITAGVGAAN